LYLDTSPGLQYEIRGTKYGLDPGLVPRLSARTPYFEFRYQVVIRSTEYEYGLYLKLTQATSARSFRVLALRPFSDMV